MNLESIARDAEDRGFAPLPPRAAELLEAVAAPPRLIAHHILVHGVALEILDALAPIAADIDGAAVAFGAATHDIGKALVHDELSAPGNEHEMRGYVWLLERGVPEPRARFARTHGLPAATPEHRPEDLLVILADTCWKGKRYGEVEERLAGELEHSGLEYFDRLLLIGDTVDDLANGANPRLAWHEQYPISV